MWYIYAEMKLVSLLTKHGTQTNYFNPFFDGDVFLQPKLPLRSYFEWIVLLVYDFYHK